MLLNHHQGLNKKQDQIARANGHQDEENNEIKES